MSIAQALMATTANIINGNKPYITFDDGLTKIETVEPLLSIKLTDGTEINVENDVSSATQPIELEVGATFDSVETLVTLPENGNNSYPTILLNSLIGDPFNYWGDDDGDGNVTIAGTLTVKWQTANNSDITQTVKNNPKELLTGCDAPYKLTLTATDGKLSTQYGIPNTRDFKGNSHTYYVKPKINKPYVCYVQPSNHDEANGLDNQWINYVGFKVQDINDPSKNFPTYGSWNLFFTMPVAGLTAEEVININGSVVSSESGKGVQLKLSAEAGNNTGNVVRVTLDGPNKRSADTTFEPSVFKLYSDKSKSDVLYSFKLQYWFIANGDNESVWGTYVPIWCQSFSGYRVPKVVEYTNASRGGRWNIYGKGYRRKINQGFFSEWGEVTEGDWARDVVAYYWAELYNSWYPKGYRYMVWKDGYYASSEQEPDFEHNDEGVDMLDDARAACISP